MHLLQCAHLETGPQHDEHRCWSTATVFSTHHHRTDYTWQLFHRLPFNEYTDSPSCFREHCTQAMRRTHLGANEHCKMGHLFNHRQCTEEVIAALPNTVQRRAPSLSWIPHIASSTDQSIYGRLGLGLSNQQASPLLSTLLPSSLLDPPHLLSSKHA